jgi:hypothetical protein
MSIVSESNSKYYIRLPKPWEDIIVCVFFIYFCLLWAMQLAFIVYYLDPRRVTSSTH